MKAHSTKVMDFVRQKPDGSYERVTWFKEKSGKKEVVKRPYSPSYDQVREMESKPHKELSLYINRKEYK